MLTNCVTSIQKSLEQTKIKGIITVVDNNSSDGTAEVIPKKFPSVHYLRNSENMGTARGFNRGIKEGMGATFTVLMNDDVELFPETISSMLHTLRIYPKARGVPACLVFPDGRPQRVKLKILGGLKIIRDERIRTAEFPGTTACLYYTDVFEKVGFFDEFFFFYNEDLDFAVRAKRKGIRFIFDPRITVKHHLNQGRSKGEKFVRPHFYAANYYYYRKNYGGFVAFLYFIAASLSIRGSVIKHKTPDRKQYDLLLQGRRKLNFTARHYREIVQAAR
jgi:GT2 family glycosyltransferase